MKPRQFAGLAILLVVALIVGAVQLRSDDDPETDPASFSGEELTIDGIIGGKVAFLQDADVIRILKDRYGLTVKFRRVGTIDQIPRCTAELDYCWPSGQNAGESIKSNLGSSVIASEIIFNSPLVLYTWTPIAEALIAQGLVERSGDTYYLRDLSALVEMIEGGKQWSDIGLSQLYGPVQILTSDPTKSNTGYSFAGLLANTMNDGVVVDTTSVQNVLPRLVAFYSKLGLLPDTTTLLFEQFLSLGMGAAPIIAAYESNLVEYTLTHTSSEAQAYVRENVRTLYAAPTVWTSHPLIALSEGGQRLMNALRDPEIQQIGWEHHGFRSAVPGVINDPAMLNLAGVPRTIDSVVPMPGPQTMDRIVAAIENARTGPTPVARREELRV